MHQDCKHLKTSCQKLSVHGIKKHLFMEEAIFDSYEIHILSKNNYQLK